MSNQTPEHEINTAESRAESRADSSAVAQKQTKALQQKKLLFVIVAVAALMVVTLMILVIGAIAQAAKDDTKGNKKPADVGSITWVDATVSTADTQKGALVVVNQDLAYATPDNTDGMINLTNFQIPGPIYTYASYSKALMQEEAARALRSMLSAFVAETGKTSYVGVRHAYRSAADQEALGSAIGAGHSDHHTGYGCELRIPAENSRNQAFTATTDADAYAWFTANAAKYGFIVRYPTDKAELTGQDNYTEYFRYVGVAHATLMAKNNLCMEEYAAYLAEHASGKTLTVDGADGRTYAIRYYAVDGETKIQVPADGDYTISGTNQGSIVLTIDLTARAEAETASETGTES